MTSVMGTTVRGIPLPSDLKTAEITGASLAYRERGSGEPVVFVHGSISDLTIWDPQVEEIGRSYRAIAYSRRYAWPNEDLPAGRKDVMQPHVDDLLAFLQSVGAYPAHLVGNSWGAFICLKAAMQSPSAVRSLVLEEPPLIPLITGAPPSLGRIAASLSRHPAVTLAALRFAAGTVTPVKKLVKAGQIEASIDRFARGVLGDQALAELPDGVRAHMHANAATHVAQTLSDGGFEPITESAIESVRTQALVVTGERSPAMFRRMAGLLASLLPESRRLEVPNASHVMHVENPAVVNAEILRFLHEVVRAN